LSSITKTREKNRCTACKRRKHVAIDEQAGKREACLVTHCDFATEILEEIERRLRFNIVPKEIKKVDIKEKEKTEKVDIKEKEKPKIELIKRK